MRNIFLTLVVAGLLVAADNTVSVSSVTDDGAGNLTISLAYDFTDDVSGFQFDLLSDDGTGANVLSLTGADGGVTDACEGGCSFSVSTSASTVLGFSFTGAIIPAGSGDFLTLTATYDTANNGLLVNITALEDCDSDGNPSCDTDDTRFVLSDTTPGDPQALDSEFVSSAWEVGDSTLENEQPLVYTLSANYPNPFNPSTTIDYSIASAGEVSIVVYDMMGRHVRTLVSDFSTAGSYNVIWDAKNDEGLSVSAGMYVYKMISGDFIEVNKMLLVK